MSMYNNLLHLRAMIAAMQLVGAFKANRGKATKTRLFVYVQVTAIIIGILAGLISAAIAFGINDVSGATLSRDLMYAPYEWASYISPMYYSVQAYFANIFGSTSVSPYLIGLTLVGLVAMLINIAIVWIFHKPLQVDKA